MKDRLIELIGQIDAKCGETALCADCPAYGKGASCINYYIAEHLIANGFIVPPVSIGDSLWNVHYNRPKEWKVVYLGFNGEEWHINVHWSDKDHFVTKEVDGKYLDRMFFRTKEEAEQALKEREEVLWT